MGSITNIKGGKFTSEDRMIYVNVNTEYDQKVNISGGNFTVGSEAELVVFSEDVDDGKDYISITGGTFNVDPGEYLASGYKATENNGTWTVSKS